MFIGNHISRYIKRKINNSDVKQIVYFIIHGKLLF